MTRNELDFTIFCIESVAERLNTSGSNVYKLLANDCKILDDYIVPYYNVLHTQGKEYIINDIIEYMKKEGVLQ